MRQRTLGGLQVSVIGLGCNNFGGRTDFATARRVVNTALDRGITLIDTADAYGGNGASEDCLGRILGERRKRIVLASKFGIAVDGSHALASASRDYILSAVEASLKRLRTDWLDLYYLHRPDAKTPIEETLRALDDLVKSGKVRAIGCSNLSAAQLTEALATAGRHRLTRFICSQDEYSLLSRGIERDVLPAIEQHELKLVPYFPLASGLLTGKYKSGAPLPQDARLGYSARHSDRFVNARNWRLVGALDSFARQRGHSILELAFGWLLSKPLVASVIAGASKPEQIEQNIAAADWTLSDDDIAEANRITTAP
jgi:aryl-alcohol dehydrogenase-like predicted oxidoreductase